MEYTNPVQGVVRHKRIVKMVGAPKNKKFHFFEFCVNSKRSRLNKANMDTRNIKHIA